ncbi:MAG: hypothetical protein JNM43_05690 [Planctomycetaceae bacterium]|nr:hypothetical protein [Planctomycetaceae bacterium]
MQFARIKSLLSIIALCWLVGCAEDAGIREYSVKGDNSRIFTSDVLRSEFGSIPFRWDVPKTWKTAQNDQFSKMAWSAGPDDTPARITISDLPSQAGIAPQFGRWAGQINFSSNDPAALMQLVQNVSLGDMNGQWIELVGPSETILGMIVPHNDSLWVVKLRAEKSVAEELKKDFRGFCESWKSG